ncbi:hypothetical protein MANES_18G061100v8 [Manihot esculenta]|uniref:Uncharacterized protein n=1 Tax=Manihot esculenta TaxID=3983 RepID=A0ACB7G2A5_MANES|nr:hypothetical protein MANES_18G061100v8 [Manihot esculenta]
MAPSFECAVSSLLCAEDNNMVFDDNDCYRAVVELFEATWHHKNHQIYCKDRAFVGGGDGELPMQSKECLALMVEKECQHLPNVDYLKRLRRGDLDLEARKEAIDWIGKKGKAWMIQLLAVACLSLAAKMEETEVPHSLDLQVGESKFVFEARTIQRMELLVLRTLSWRMQAITPFSFIDQFLDKINNDETPPRSLIWQSIQLILSTTRGIEFLEFRPSEIAAAVAIAVVGEIKTVDAEQAIPVLSQHVEKERVLKCIQVIHEMSLIGGYANNGNASILYVPQSPIGVLDAACLSYRSDDTTVGLCANSSQNTPDAKRRKLNGQWEL